MKLPWIIRVLCEPVQELDLTDDKGQPDHGKILPAILLVSAIVLQFLGMQYAIGVLVVLGSLAYGYGAWRSFLKSKSITGTFSEETKKVDIKQEITERIIKRRDTDEGIEPTED